RACRFGAFGESIRLESQSFLSGLPLPDLQRGMADAELAQPFGAGIQSDPLADLAFAREQNLASSLGLDFQVKMAALADDSHALDGTGFQQQLELSFIHARCLRTVPSVPEWKCRHARSAGESAVR